MEINVKAKNNNKTMNEDSEIMNIDIKNINKI